jgi:hypothetical protein
MTPGEQHQWHYFRNDEVIAALRSLFKHCKTVAFDDWSGMVAGSDLLDGLLSDVIKPLGKTNIEFIFYLGDPTQRLSFQVDEVLDIISDFSLHGKVTFALDENEALKLWSVLNGIHADALSADQNFVDLRKKYFSLFRTMSIPRLLVYSANTVLLFSEAEQFVLSRKMVDHSTEIAPDARQNFIAGFSGGLLLHLDIAHCIALGLVVFGCCGEPKTTSLEEYINNWVSDLERPETMHLYQ